jgi:peptidoglycan/xylan/chitin deacetylase (PgdA/CDA1 family)
MGKITKQELEPGFSQELKDTRKFAQNEKPITGLVARKNNKPLVSFVDDDGAPQVMTKLLPLGQKHGIPFVIAPFKDGLLSGHGIDLQDAKDLQDIYGFEIASHSVKHIPINSDLSLDDQHHEVYESWRWMRENGLRIEAFVYPYGQSTSHARDIVSRYYKCGIGTSSFSNGKWGEPLPTQSLGRHPFPDGDGTKPLSHYTAIVDNAIQENSWVIFMLHCGQSVHDAKNQQILDDLIAYIKTTSAEIVTVSDGMDIAGNAFEFNDQSLYISKTGQNNIRDLEYKVVDPTTGIEQYDFDTPPSAFPVNKVSVHAMVNAPAYNKGPSKGRGTLVTFRNPGEVISHQVFYSNVNIFYRFASNNTSWGSWRKTFVGATEELTLDFGTIPANSGKTVGITDAKYIVNSTIQIAPITDEVTFPAGVMLSAVIRGGWLLSITAFNATSGSITLGSRKYKTITMM